MSFQPESYSGNSKTQNSTTLTAINIRKFINDNPVSKFQWRVGLLAFIVLILDGYDIVSIGFIIPPLIDAWHISRESMGSALVAGLVGLAAGAFFGGPIADRIGRRKVIIGSILFFGIMSFASAFSPDLATLVVMRFLTGLGLGASQPNTGTLISEFAPWRHRSIFVTATYCGFTVGGAAGGFLSAGLLTTYGWPSILIIGGIVPILFALLCIFWLPESPGYLVLRPDRHPDLIAILNKIKPGSADSRTRFIRDEDACAKKASFAQVLSKEHAATTLLLWLGIFSTMLTIYLMYSWLPTLIKSAGFSVSDAALITGMGWTGGIAGNIFVGWAMDRWEPHRVVALVLVAAGLFALMIGASTMGVAISSGVLMGLIFGLGFNINSSNTTWIPLATSYYPTEIRATGTGWLTAAGRLGAISGASVGALLVAFQLSMGQIFYFLCVPIALGILAAASKGLLFSARKKTDGTSVAT